jgi:hypothetical protein
MMSAMDDTETRAAFLIAALVLLVMPLVYVVGLASIVLFLRMADVDIAGRIMIIASAVWGVLLLVAVLIVTRRLIRRSAQA